MQTDDHPFLSDAYEMLGDTAISVKDNETGESYVYAGLDKLRSGIPANIAGRRVSICAYRVIESPGSIPLLLFALQRKTERLTWPVLDSSVIEPRLLCEAETLLVDSLQDYGPAAMYRGWRNGEDEVQLWFELNCVSMTAMDVRKLNRWRWVMPSEIVNEGEVAGDKVEDCIREDLLSNPALCLLMSKEQEAPLPSARAGYYCGSSKSMGFAAVVGPKRAGPSAPFGPHYYLDSYSRALATMNRGKDANLCIVRYAVIIGRQAMLLGRPTDPQDKAPMTKHLALARPLVRETSRVRDADSKWSRDCDGISRGRLSADAAGTRHTLEPRICVEDLRGLVPLDYCGPPSEACVPSTCISSSVSYTGEHEHNE